MTEMDGVADYDRQDRGIQAHNLFIVAPPLLETTPDRPDPRKQPTRGALMPSVLTEVGSITHRAEQDLLASETGQRAAAQGIFDALQGQFANRALGAAYQVPRLEPMPGTLPAVEAGDGPMFWAPPTPAGPLEITAHQHRHRIVAVRPDAGGWLGGERPAVPARAAGMPSSRCWTRRCRRWRPGESVDVAVTVPGTGSTARGVAWITLADGDRAWTEMGIPPLQVAIGG